MLLWWNKSKRNRNQIIVWGPGVWSELWRPVEQKLFTVYSHYSTGRRPGVSDPNLKHRTLTGQNFLCDTREPSTWKILWGAAVQNRAGDFTLQIFLKMWPVIMRGLTEQRENLKSLHHKSKWPLLQHRWPLIFSVLLVQGLFLHFFCYYCMLSFGHIFNYV